jgi:ATP-dependent DNA helicase RecG
MSEFSANIMSRLAKIGIEEPWQLIKNLPASYDDFTAPAKSVAAMRRLGHRKSCYANLILSGVRTSEEINRAKGAAQSADKRDYVLVELSDGQSKVTGFVFGKTAIKDWIERSKSHLNQIVPVHGQIDINDQYVNLKNLMLVPTADQNRIVARYRGKEGVVNPFRLADLTQIALLYHLDEAIERITDALDEDEQTILRNCSTPFPSLKSMIMNLHIPTSRDELTKAQQGARDLNAYYGVRKAMISTERKPAPKAAIPINKELIRDLVGRLPYKPTGDQRKAIWDIIQDLSHSKPMDRLLSADVGNGKTLAYGVPAAYATSLGKNTVILLPTEPLAAQVADDIKNWFPELRVHRVGAGFNGKVEQGDMIIGTTAVLTWLKNHPEWTVDFAITDEQQKMGTAQRDALTGAGTHVLEATATPIPRTMAQTIFGNKKISIIDESPVVKNITTRLLGNNNEDRRLAMDTLDAWLAKGRKVAVIYPLVAEQQAYFYQIKAQTPKEAEKVAALLRKAGMTVQNITPVDQARNLIAELDNAADEGFLAELHGEEQDHTRLQKRFDHYLGDHAANLRYLGSRIDDELALKNRSSIMQGAAKWEKRHPGRVAVIHGRSHRNEKVEIINHMNQGGADVLVATTLVEIGVTVRGLNALAVIGAEKLGAFTLHQLRGRLSRDGGDGDFMMMASSPLEELEPTSRDRLDLLVRFKRGDEIAMHDMDQRGFGNLAAGGQQKGFDEGLFPSLKLTTHELETFLRNLAKKMGKPSVEKAELTP